MDKKTDIATKEEPKTNSSAKKNSRQRKLKGTNLIKNIDTAAKHKNLAILKSLKIFDSLEQSQHSLKKDVQECMVNGTVLENINQQASTSKTTQELKIMLPPTNIAKMTGKSLSTISSTSFLNSSLKDLKMAKVSDAQNKSLNYTKALLYSIEGVTARLLFWDEKESHCYGTSTTKQVFFCLRT